MNWLSQHDFIKDGHPACIKFANYWVKVSQAQDRDPVSCCWVPTLDPNSFHLSKEPRREGWQ